MGLRVTRETEGSGVLGLDWEQRLDTCPHVVGRASREELSSRGSVRGARRKNAEFAPG